MQHRDLRAVFDEVAELYDRARPVYPDSLVSDLARLAGIGSGSSVVEVGPGTGQATAALAALGASVTAVEPGAALARVLSRKLAAAGVRVVVSAFEDWPLPDKPVDAVVCFTAWHWLDPAVRTAHAAAALRPGGTLATVSTKHLAGGTENFFEQVQDCYVRWDPATPVGLRLAAAADVPIELDEVDGSHLFDAAVRRRYQQVITYTTRDYLDLLSTYSNHRALDRERRENLFACIAELIDGTYGGAVSKHYLYDLRLATRRAGPSFVTSR